MLGPPVASCLSRSPWSWTSRQVSLGATAPWCHMSNNMPKPNSACGKFKPPCLLLCGRHPVLQPHTVSHISYAATWKERSGSMDSCLGEAFVKALSNLRPARKLPLPDTASYSTTEHSAEGPTGTAQSPGRQRGAKLFAHRACAPRDMGLLCCRHWYQVPWRDWLLWWYSLARPCGLTWFAPSPVVWYY